MKEKSIYERIKFIIYLYNLIMCGPTPVRTWSWKLNIKKENLQSVEVCASNSNTWELLTKPGDLSSIHGIHLVERENQTSNGRRLSVQGYLRLQSGFQVSLSYRVRHCLTRRKKRKEESIYFAKYIEKPVNILWGEHIHITTVVEDYHLKEIKTSTIK